MKISFHGASGEVTGSCSLIEHDGQKILIDCGMFQGDEKTDNKNFDQFIFDPVKLDAVIVTHAHLDHIGRLPLLIQRGYGGKIYCNPATAELTKVILEDAVSVMEYDYHKTGKPVLYTLDDVERVMSQIESIDYHIKTAIGKIYFTFYDAGHIFGSAFIELNVDDKKIVFSGDLGNTDMPILRATESLSASVDLVVCESTYGGRIHEAKNHKKREELIEQFITLALKTGGVLMIPSFALERTQELLYVLNDLIDRQHRLPRVPIFLDSPLAIKATEIFRHFPEYYNKEAVKLYKADDDLFQFPGLVFCESRDDSKKINHLVGPKIIIAGAGMMNGGRIVHHAKRYLSDYSNTLLFIGYQASGTLGRQILERRSQVNILGDKIPVRCHIKAIGALSAHADQEEILNWLKSGKNYPKKVILNHGEVEQANILYDKIRENLGVEVDLAKIDKEWNL